MNKYAARGILIDVLVDRKRFVVVAGDGRAVQEALHVFARVINDLGIDHAKVRRANGAERITFPSGAFIAFATPRSNRLRGMSADVVFIDREAHRVLERRGVHDHAAYGRFRGDVASVLTASRGEVVHS